MPTPREKFVSIAEKRVNKTIKDINLIGNLSNKSNYAYTESDIGKIFSALNKELRKAQERFSNVRQEADNSFKLSE